MMRCWKKKIFHLHRLTKKERGLTLATAFAISGRQQDAEILNVCQYDCHSHRQQRQVSQSLTVVAAHSAIDSVDTSKGCVVHTVHFAEGVAPFILDFRSGLIRKNIGQHQLCDQVVDPPETAFVGHTGSLQQTPGQWLF